MYLNKREREILRNGAMLYAKADRSDPFAYNRAMSHTENGQSGFYFDNNNYKQDGFYTAEEYQEERTLPDGTKYSVPAYKNIKRP